MKYAHIISDMTWSYSRITTYEDCKYKFFLKYIKHEPTVRHFFSDYGTFMHLIIQKFLIGELKESELVNYYLINFRKNIKGKAPNEKIYHNYFKQGMSYLATLKKEDEEILGVEREIEFEINGNNFIGFIDKVSRNDEGLIITDNKSRNLKERTTKKTPTKSDLELDKFLRQLYIYAVAIEQDCGELPQSLIFNCFRSSTQIKEDFNTEKYEEAKVWATGLIETITEEEDWSPNIDFFKCRYLCDVCESCEYFQLSVGDKNKRRW